MTTPNPEVPESVLAALQSSGFPFQTAVAHVINASTKSTAWKVYASEYPWQTSGGDSHFIDIVASNEVFYLTIECKKTRKEILTFLRPLGLSNTGVLEEFRCLRAQQVSAGRYGLEIYCENWAIIPESTSSEFCVLSTSGSGKDQRLLERDAGLVVRGTDAFAQDFRQRFRSERDPVPPKACIFVPVIITNAPIYTARYKPSDVSLESGEFSVLPGEINQARWVRFRKAFTSDGGPDLGDRSVFVVHATSFEDFLKQVTLAPIQPQERAAAHYSKN